MRLLPFLPLLFLPACTSQQSLTPHTPATLSATKATPLSYDPVLDSKPWSQHGVEGRLITTPSYRIFTTESNPLVAARIPLFLETALLHYRTAITPLDAPSGQMETYILASRRQWARLTAQLMGPRARTYLNIRAGGFAEGGRAMLFNIGSRGTFATAAHEGWHQFTQRSFRQPLPIWMEEGLATYMEGFRWDERQAERPVFLPWANVERYDRLREMVHQGRLLPLEALLAARPQDLMTTTSNDDALDYYSQVWALAHFLAEGEGGRYRAGLERMVRDARHGRQYETSARQAPASELRDLVRRRTGPAPFRAYIADDLKSAGEAYDRFIRTIVAPGGRDRIVQGESPL